MEENKDVKSMSCYEIFADINSRQITALMFHTEMADMFDFLGLMGFKRMHEYQYFSESAEHRGIKRYYINHHNKLLRGKHLPRVEVIPDSWYKYSRFDVTPQIRKQYVEEGLKKYQAWEKETKEMYENYAAELMRRGNVADFNKVKSLVCDVDMEVKCVDRLIIELESVGYNDVYIASIQEEMHEKYREMTNKIGISIC